MGRDYHDHPSRVYYRSQQWDEERPQSATTGGYGGYTDDGRHAGYVDDGRHSGYTDDGRQTGYADDGRTGVYADNGRYHNLTGVVPIEMALREHCRIPVKRYFLAVQTDDGRIHYMHSQQKLQERDVFNKEGVEALVPESDSRLRNHADAPEYNAYGMGGHRGTHSRLGHTYDAPLSSPWEEDEYIGGSHKARKRQRAQANFRGAPDLAPGDNEMVAVSPPVPQHRGIMMAEEKVILEFCETRFKNLQQMACKIVAKAWVKIVEPKKQTNHPYTVGDQGAPPWWPQPWGKAKEDRVRHKEPDHLLKKERVSLLIHILQLVVQPNHNQHPDIQKLDLNVTKLEEATTEALSAFFLDKENPGNAKRKVYLKEIFKVAKAQERYLNGEVDGDYKVWVNADDKIADEWQSGDDRSAGPWRHEDDVQQPHMGRGNSAPPSQPSPLKSTMMQPTFTPHTLPEPSSDHSTSPMHHGAGGDQFLGGVPVRTLNEIPSFPAPDMYTGLPSSRRTSIYGLTTEYTSGSAGGTAAVHGMYTPPWPSHGPGSTAPTSSTSGNPGLNFGFTSQPQTLPLPAPYVTQAAVQANQHAVAAPGTTYLSFIPVPKVDSPSAGGTLHEPDGHSGGPSPHQTHAMNLARHPLPTAPSIGAGAPSNYNDYGTHEARHLPRPLP